MRLTLAAIGKLRSGPEAALVDDYAQRIAGVGPRLGFPSFDIRTADAPRALVGEARQLREHEILTSLAPKEGLRIVLDERGKALSSESFAARLQDLRQRGAPDLAFLIGGADGHTEEMRRSADLILSFGPATWPHMLVRIMLCEQIYRAMTILSGHPYHRA